MVDRTKRIVVVLFGWMVLIGLIIFSVHRRENDGGQGRRVVLVPVFTNNATKPIPPVSR